MQKTDVNTQADAIRHSLAHLLAASVLKKYPKAKLGIGPVIENGFYYDIKFPRPINDEDLKEFEASMRAMIAEGLPIKGEKVTPAKARSLFKDQPFKLDLIKDFVKDKKPLTVYHTGLPSKTKNSKVPLPSYFLDLCRGGHVKNTSEINPEVFKLAKIAGAYWKGDEKNAQLTRIYGYAFETKAELDQHLAFLEEATARDHRKLGRELDLFVFADLVGPGLPLYTPRGTTILMAIKDYSRAMRRRIGYQEVQTPQINKGELFKISGHYDKYKDDMFRAQSNYSKEEYFLKPMNCPQHTQIYASTIRSYKDLPLKYADFAVLYRDEKPGELSGLTRLRAFSQDDGHCFCREDQIEHEFSLVLGVIKEMLASYGLEYYVRLSLRDEKNKSAYLGADATWKKSQTLLRKLLEEERITFEVAEGEAAFYGPKMDIIAKDAIGREWQVSTIQLDFNMPERFGLEYTGEDGKKHRPIMIHNALVGSPERMFGVLIEHYKGAFPFWLAPVQIKILAINDKVLDYAGEVQKQLGATDVRVELDDRNESVGKKIREAEMQKIPYLIIIGEKEKAANTISIRERGKGDQGAKSIDQFLKAIPEAPAAM